VSWDATRRFRVIAESDTESGVGGELQYSQQFGGTPVGLREGGTSNVSGPTADVAASVRSVQAQTDGGLPQAKLVKAAKIRVGDPFDRGKMLQGGDRIRLALLKAGFIEATVRAEAALDEGPPRAYGIDYRVAEGPRIAIEFVLSDGKGKRGLRKTLKTFWADTPYTPDFWDEATRALLDQLQEDGYYAADVTWRAVDGPSGKIVRFVVDRGKPVRLRAVRFSGVHSIPLARVTKQLTSLKSQALHKPLLRPSVLSADLAAVRALYRDEGFTRVRIGQPQVSLSTAGDSAEVDVAIQEGEHFTVGEVTFSGADGTPEAELRAATPLKEGQTFSPRALAESEQALKDHIDGLGHPDANVESRVELQTDEADVAFDVAAGPRMTVDTIKIAGNRVTKNRTISKALSFGRGDLVTKKSLLTSQQQLYRTGLFSNVKLTYAPAEADDATAQTVTVKVEEAPPLSLGLGVGYDSQDGPRASFLLGYANLGGRGVGIAFQGRIGTKENRALLTLRRRRAFGNTIDALSSLLYERTVETGFSNSRKGFSVRLEQRPKPRWIRFLRYSIQDVNIYDITDAEAALTQIFEDKLSSIRLADIGLGLVRDTRDDAFSTTRGGYGSIETSIFAEPLGSQASFVKVFVRGSWTAPMKRGLRFATFVRIGAEPPFGDTAVVPLSERFFAGGSNTMRGFATDSVGGINLSGFYAGGEALLILNEELSFPIWRTLRGEMFLDAGNVYPKVSDFDATDLRSSAGLGLRLDTPIGPIRIEYGWKLDRMEGESAGELVFSIGTVF
jgi:outer membrane protein assembly complex protein YaeT